MSIKTIFLSLVGVQALHSMEEYVFRLWDVFPPAQLLTSLVSSNLARGFVVINSLIVAFGAWCFWWPVRREWSIAVPLAWFWVIIALINGVVHPLWSLVQGGYTPGVVTALVLLPLAIWLARALVKRRDHKPIAA